MKGLSITAGQSGGVLVMTALLLFAIIGFTALAIDVGHLVVVQNELRNAADAGALAGAGMLYTINADDTIVGINTGANDVASAATSANMSDAAAAEVISVERGHWCFNCGGGGTGVFTPNATTTLDIGSLSSLSPAALDANTAYVNAVRVVAGRGPAIPAASFFAGIWNWAGFTLNAEAVAWLGPGGNNFTPDFPLAICKESILDSSNNFTCSHGRMINSSGSGYTTETGGWTNLEQPNACGGAAPASEVTNLISNGCSGSLSDITLYSGEPMTTVGGQLQSAYTPFFNCWKNKISLDLMGADGIPDRPWSMTLPLIECGSSNPGPCNTVVGAIKVEVLWITNQNDPHFHLVPTRYQYNDSEISVSYTCPATCTPTADQPVCASLATEDGRKLCWANFLTSNHVVDESGVAFTVDKAAEGYLQKNIIFKPSCSPASAGSTVGPGSWSGILSKRPKLVK